MIMEPVNKQQWRSEACFFCGGITPDLTTPPKIHFCPHIIIHTALEVDLKKKLCPFGRLSLACLCYQEEL